MDHFPKVSVSILCWNGRNFLEAFLPSVLKSSYPNLEIVVIDNASTDDSVSFLEQHFPDIRLIKIEKNEGFAKGYNQALRLVEADYIILLNQDVEVEPGWIEPIIEMMETDQTIAACQPKILSQKQKTHFEYAGAAGGLMDTFAFTFCRGRIFDQLEKDESQYDEAVEVFWVSGAALFIRPKLFESIGGFDESFFAHMEEIDLCWRLKRAGYKLIYCPTSVVYHVGGGSLPQGNPRKTYLNFRNNLAMMIKNQTGRSAFFKIFFRLLLDFLAFFRALISGQWGDAKAICKAEIHVLFRLGYWLRQRSRVNKIVKYNAIGPANLNGYYTRSIVWDYFVRRKKVFTDLSDSAFIVSKSN